jgi:hypothetical protein
MDYGNRKLFLDECGVGKSKLLITIVGRDIKSIIKI